MLSFMLVMLRQTADQHLSMLGLHKSSCTPYIATESNFNFYVACDMSLHVV